MVHIKHFLGCTGCSMSCDCHDNVSFWHGNASTALTRSNSCHSTVSHDTTCKPYGVNLISETSPRKHSMCTRPFFWGWGLGTRPPLAGQKSRSLESANDTKSGEQSVFGEIHTNQCIWNAIRNLITHTLDLQTRYVAARQTHTHMRVHTHKKRLS